MIDTTLEVLSEDDCIRLLRGCSVGRVGVVVDDYPVVLPVNYRMVEDRNGFCLVVRTRPGGLIDQPGRVGFQIDGIDPFHQQGWSVLVRGCLGHVDAEDLDRLSDSIDPRPWVGDRDSWLVIRPVAISGRRLHPPEVEWVLHAGAYL
jgi:nitroimidazol reductase NimA-like FMN-containing flavoprotein (pyridoxamine 5'-phosphate oxidase superfamily)